MSEDRIIIIEGKRYALPHVPMDKDHKHRNKKNWVSMWFYKNRKKTRVLKSDVKEDLIITSKLEYQKGIFYKMSQLSAEDESFDYFYKLKEGGLNNIVKKNQRYKVGINRKNAWRDTKPNYETDKAGNFIVSFE